MDNCTDGCVNTEGSYYCTCNDGYELTGDNRTCVGELMVYTTCFTYSVYTATISIKHHKSKQCFYLSQEVPKRYHLIFTYLLVLR